MATNISHSPAETEALGETWGKTARSGWVIGLSGELGAGKTQLVKGLARGLGISARVHSPSFKLVNIYSGGRLTLFHLDLYRLPTDELDEQIHTAGLEEYLKPAGVAVIEWAEKLFEPRRPGLTAQRLTQMSRELALHSPKDYRSVRIEVLTETERRITYEDSGT